MNRKRFRHFFVALTLVFTTLLSATHHHNDLKKHTDCQICTLSFSLEHQDSVDTPSYVPTLYSSKEITVAYFVSYTFELIFPHNSRAPPSFFI
jgi:hypothetical protein